MGTMSDQRDVFVEKIKAKLDEWNAEIARLEAKARQQEADTKLKLEEQIETLRKKRKSTEADLDKLCQAGDSAWEDLKSGVESAATSLGEAIKSANSRFT
jgi:uncharacterized coiled-coil DUF342 family protein